MLSSYPSEQITANIMGRPSNKDQRRHQIAAALLAVMAERGYEGASINITAERAGLAPGLIHYYFKNKHEILLYAIRELIAVVKQRYDEIAATSKTPDARLRAFVHARLAKGPGADSAAVASWVMIAAEAIRQPEVKAVYEEAMATQQVQLKCLLSDYAGDRLKTNELRELTAVLLATIEGIFHLSVSADGIMPKDYAAKTVMKVIERYIGYKHLP